MRACRQLLAYLLREIDIQRRRIQQGQPVDDTMLTRLVRFQLGQSAPGAARPADLDPRLVSDLRIAENVMGTIVGAVAGQEEATCRAIDAVIRLQEGQYRTSGRTGTAYGSFAEAQRLALESSRAATPRRVAPSSIATRWRRCGSSRKARSCSASAPRTARPSPAAGRLSAGTLVFAAHGSAMKDVPEPDAFMLDRPREHWLPYGWNRHTCLGQHVSPVIIIESMVAVLGLQDVGRPEPRAGEPSFPLERRFGRLQLDDQNLYAMTFSLRFSDSGTTRRFWPVASH